MPFLVPFLSVARMIMLVGQLLAQAADPQSVSGKLDASSEVVRTALASSSNKEVVIGSGPYLYWNRVPSEAPSEYGTDDGGYTAVVGDVLTFRYNSDNNVYLMATESDWRGCENFNSGALVGARTMNNAGLDYYGVGLTNVYQAVVEQEGTLYFSCQRGGQSTCDHCMFGQKIKVRVGGERPPAPPPPPPLPCNLVENCDCSCCDADTCPGWPASQRVYVHFKFNVDSPASCDAAACSSKFDRRAA